MKTKILILMFLTFLLTFSHASTVCSSPSANPACPSKCLNAGISCSQQPAGTNTPTIIGTDLTCVKTLNAGCGFALNFQLSSPNPCPNGFTSMGSSSCGFLSFLFGGVNNCANYIDIGCLNNNTASCPAGYTIFNSTTCSLPGTPINLYQQCCDIPNPPQTFPIHNATCSSLSSGTSYDYSCVGTTSNCTLNDSNNINCPNGYQCNNNSASPADDCIAMQYTITGVTVYPNDILVSPGCYQFSANQTTSINSQIPASGVLWGSNDSNINVSQNGLVCIPSNYSGSFMVTASVTPWLGIANVNVVNVTNFSITPSVINALPGSIVYLQASGVSTASKKTVNLFSNWNLNSISGGSYFVGSVDGQFSYYSATGSMVLLNVGEVPGNYSLTATYSFLNATVNISVLTNYTPPVGVPPVLQLHPSNATIPSGETQQFFLTATDIKGVFLPVYNITWSVNNISVARVDVNGVVTALQQGFAILNASSGGYSASALVNVNPCVIGSVGESGTENVNGVSCALKSVCVLGNYGIPQWSGSTKADACCGSIFNGTATADGCCHKGYEIIDPNCKCSSSSPPIGPFFENNCWGYVNCNTTTNLFTDFIPTNNCNPIIQNSFTGYLCAFTNPQTSSSINTYENGNKCLNLSVSMPTSCVKTVVQFLNIGDNYTISQWTYNLFDASIGGVLLNVYNSSGLQETAPVTTAASTILPNANVSIISVYPNANATLNFTYNNCSS